MFRKKTTPLAEIVACFRGTLTDFVWSGISPSYVPITAPHNDLASRDWARWGSEAVVKRCFKYTLFAPWILMHCLWGNVASLYLQPLRITASNEKYYWCGARKILTTTASGGRRSSGHLCPQLSYLLGLGLWTQAHIQHRPAPQKHLEQLLRE